MIDLARETAEICMDMFGEGIIYNGEEKRAIANVEMIELSGYEQAVEQRMTISILTADYPAITPGALVEVRSKSYRVDQQMETQDDPNIMVKLVLR
ncbi:hypothetical protein GCM10011533_30370 [Streptosporangium jomthongense]|uniref:Phage protein n=1 Tax=Marinobacter aromaticivorans TaxID=1494078 RepID=A0ABW2IXX0_9GAMM|nr:hypothetical protein [Marinobacter aromaticivorans]GGE75921.1 hypothetical protein GCM10011533_30370 [Streptosporangium jomthongense]